MKDFGWKGKTVCIVIFIAVIVLGIMYATGETQWLYN